jgi:hypothetical protein
MGGQKLTPPVFRFSSKNVVSPKSGLFDQEVRLSYLIVNHTRGFSMNRIIINRFHLSDEH